MNQHTIEIRHVKKPWQITFEPWRTIDNDVVCSKGNRRVVLHLCFAIVELSVVVLVVVGIFQGIAEAHTINEQCSAGACDNRLFR